MNIRCCSIGKAALLIICLSLPVSVFATPQGGINWWLTKRDQSVLLQRQNAITFGSSNTDLPFISVDSGQVFQRIDGFGYTLTGSSAILINGLDAGIKANLLKELFGSDGNSIGISYIRISIGSSDLNPTVFSCDDVPGDESLSKFNLGPDKTSVVPLLQQILKINPGLKILASPWSAPAWMKDNNSAIGGTLLQKYYQLYADYLVKYLQTMNAAGIPIESLTPQNEPMDQHNNPSMGWSAEQELAFVKNNLGPAIKKAGLATKIIVWDHNCDNPQYPIKILSDPTAKQFIAGSAFHLYAGDASAMSTVHNAFPDKNVYFTEQYTDIKGDFGGDLMWHMRHVVTATLRNWSRNVIEWNLANDPNYGMHTPGGCSVCKGALTISGSSVKRNVSYYIIAHESKFVPAGSVRIWSSQTGDLYTVAFMTPDKQKVLVVENDGSTSTTFNIKYQGKLATVTLDGGSVGTYVW